MSKNSNVVNVKSRWLVHWAPPMLNRHGRFARPAETARYEARQARMEYGAIDGRAPPD